MKNLIILAITFLIMLSANASAQTKKSEISNPLNFQKIEIERTVPSCRSSLKNCGNRALVALDLAGFGGPDYIKYKKEVFNFKSGVGIYLLTIKGFRDPLVSGERIRLAFRKRGTTYSFVQAGRQYMCVSGSSKGKWQKQCMPNNGDNSEENKTSMSEIKNSDDFKFVSINGRVVGEATRPCKGSLLECGSKTIGYYGIEGVGGEDNNPNFREETFEYKSGKGKNYSEGERQVGVYLLTRTGFEDDSVSGERLRLEFVRQGDVWILVIGGKQFQCARGANAGSWTKNLCP